MASSVTNCCEFFRCNWPCRHCYHSIRTDRTCPTKTPNWKAFALRLLDAGHRPCDIVRDLKVSKTTVMKVQRQVKNGEGVDTKPRSGRPRSIRTPATIKTTKKLVKKTPSIIVAKVARKVKILRRSIERLIKEDLASNSRKIRDVPSVGNSAPRRIERAKVLLNFVKSSEHSKKVRIFSDEKLLVVDQVINRQNDRYITDLPVSLVDPGVKFNSVSKHPAKIMVLGIVASDGKRCPLSSSRRTRR